MNAAFTYDSDGRRVKSVLTTNIATTTTFFVGAYYEVTQIGANTQINKYYYAGAQRIAMRNNGTLFFLIGDHLGSTSLVTFENGNVVSETRFKAWGEVRYESGTMPTKYTYTGQYSYTADFGLMFYNARWVDVSLGRFAQADSIVPRSIQGLDRFAYSNNNPIIYTDPSGHRPCDEHSGCGIDAKPQTSCSIGQGYFNGNFGCTPAQLNEATIAERKAWFNEMLGSVDPDLPTQFTNINGILNAFIDTGEGSPNSWTSWGDAGILNSIQNGLAIYLQNKLMIDPDNPYSGLAASAWNEYFISYFRYGVTNTTLQRWGNAEGLGTSYGILLASEHGATKTPGEVAFLFIGNWYRNELKNRKDPSAQQWSKLSTDFYSWMFDTRSTIRVPYTDLDTHVPIVSLLADLLLRIK